ncbi:hypothetical protein D9611_011423 [Ephemerocybe angulata]|uniref:Glycosyltransferase 2-like domain-containing protein n=1 Tax=Ephemerocybe angulata TaxID=980116 RepID=A0A8H5FJY4_9AGAR|nr:hypothetical protein D9611_011423 [Tulosesus angulatus]
MDYDRNDALLHWLFRQTQGDAWFRPNEEHVSSGVALRVSDAAHAGQPEFRVFPYENAALEPFESAVAKLNPVVAVKVRSAAVHAALGEVGPEDTHVYVDAETRIQILETMLALPGADREQCAAFIRDERVMVIWSESIDRIVPLCNDFEERLIKLLWRSRPLAPPSVTSGNQGSASVSAHGSVAGHATGSDLGTPASFEGFGLGSQRGSRTLQGKGVFGELGRDPLEAVELGVKVEEEKRRGKKHVVKRTWLGRKKIVEVDVAPGDEVYDGSEKGAWDEEAGPLKASKRPVKLYAPVYNGLAAGLALVFIGNGVRTLLMEWRLDGDATRFALLAVAPLLYCVSLFFALQIVQNISMALGPIAHFHSNSKYYSAIKPRPNKAVDMNLPHVTIQMPVYKESLEQVLAPSIRSLKKAMQTYARQGGTSNIFVNDDGLRLLPAADRDARLAFYANHNIGWVARPKHDDAPGGFKRAGRFKKASNMNYGLALSLKMEKHLETLMAEDSLNRSSLSNRSSSNGEATQYGIQYQNRDGAESVVWGLGGINRGAMGMPVPGHMQSGSGFVNGGGANGSAGVSASASGGSLAHWGDADLEEKALSMAIEEVYDEHSPSTIGGNGGGNGGGGEPGVKWPRPWAANGRSCRIGEIVLIVDSDTLVPEDCLRDAAREMGEDGMVAVVQHESGVLGVAGHYFENGIAYFTRRINRCISISCANGEVAPFMGHNAFLRWRAIQDAAFVDPADGQVKIWSESNVSEDFDMALRLMLKGYIIRWATYSEGGFKEGVSLSADDELNRWQKYAYGCNELLFNPIVEWWRRGPISSQIHRFLWCEAPLHYKISMLSYMFSYYGIAGSITIGLINYVLLGFQFPVDGYFMHAFEIWLATTVVFWGSGTVGYTLLEYRLGRKSLAILAHLFSYNMQWAATKKEVERSNFFKEIPKIAKRFWFPLLVSFAIIAGMVILSTKLVPFEWRVDGNGWAVILPLAMTCGCHILYPIVLNPWLMVFSY